MATGQSLQLHNWTSATPTREYDLGEYVQFSWLKANSWGPNLSPLPAAGGITPFFLERVWIIHHSIHWNSPKLWRPIPRQDFSSKVLFCPFAVNFQFIFAHLSLFQSVVYFPHWNANRREIWKDKQSDWKKGIRGNYTRVTSLSWFVGLEWGQNQNHMMDPLEVIENGW